MRIWPVVNAFLVTLFSASIAQSGVQTPSKSRIENVAAQLNTILQCPNRVWPGLKKESYQILFVQPSSKKAWFWSAVTGAADKVDFSFSSEIPKYSLQQFRNERAVVINLDKTSENPRVSHIPVDGAVNLAFHEGFHFLFQMKEPWVSQFAAATRKSDLDRVTAVYSRKMLIRALKNEIVSNREYGRSAFWFQKWNALGEAAETKFSDILEGTANYVELMASIIASQGCEVTEKQIVETALASLDSLVNLPFPPNVMKQLFAEYVASGYQIEGYEIGLLSLLALRSQGVVVGQNEYPMGRDFVKELQAAATNEEKLKVVSEMRSAVEKVKTPVELLLKDSSPIHDEDDPVLLEAIRQAAQ